MGKYLHEALALGMESAALEPAASPRAFIYKLPSTASVSFARRRDVSRRWGHIRNRWLGAQTAAAPASFVNRTIDGLFISATSQHVSAAKEVSAPTTEDAHHRANTGN